MGDLSISQVSARPGRIGIRARQMFDGYRFQRGPVLVVVEDGRISAVDFAGSACPDMNLVDLGESTLLPGLVDAHAHLCWDPDGRPEDLAGDPMRCWWDGRDGTPRPRCAPGSPRFAISATVTMRPWRCGRSIGRKRRWGRNWWFLGHH